MLGGKSDLFLVQKNAFKWVNLYRYTEAFLWDTGSTVGEITGMTKRVNSVDFKPGRPYRIAAGSEDFTVSLYEGPPFKFKHTPHKHGGAVQVESSCAPFTTLHTHRAQKAIHPLHPREPVVCDS
jgi:hypothetical protein